jgi:hypothetical protein
MLHLINIFYIEKNLKLCPVESDGPESIGSGVGTIGQLTSVLHGLTDQGVTTHILQRLSG